MKASQTIFSFFLVLFLFQYISPKFLENQSFSEEEDVIATITEDDENALREALLILWKSGGIIYIDTPEINIKKQESLSIKGTYEGGIVGIKQENGEYPRLNFKEQRDSVTLLYMSGISITGSNKLIKNLIIENAGTTGISISGQKNIIDHVITRYNGQSGIYLSPETDSNTLNYCYSYRNFHFLENRLVADGFTVEIGGINNVFNNCFAWENSQNGFGYNYWDGKHKNGALTYTHSASWNNGNMDVFSGKYDYNNGNKLDKNMWTIQQIIKSNPYFEFNYNDRFYSIDDATINSIPAIQYFKDYKTEDGGNGFNFGNEKNEQNAANRRTVDYCVAFDHNKKGFSSNESKNFTGLFTNSVAFSNNMNYDLPYSFVKWNNNWGWESSEEDIFDLDVYTKQPRDTSSSKNNFYSVRDQIIKAVYANTFPDDINFDKVIKGLTE